MFLNRIPTDVCIHWISILQTSYNHPLAGKNKSLLLELLKARKLQWMAHNLTIKAMKESLKKDSGALRKAGLYQLADIAYNESKPSNNSLYNHLPVNNNYESVKHLLADNMYGAAFDSFWIDILVEHRNSQSLFQTMEKIGLGLSKLFHELDQNQRNRFLDRIVEELRTETNSRFWHRNTSNLQQLIQGTTYDQKSKALDFILKKRINTGFGAILIPYLTIVIYLAYGRALSDGKKSVPEWLKVTQANYYSIITPYRQNNSITYPTPLGNGKHITTSGITQIHHPPTNPMKDNPLNHRWSLMREPQLSGALTKIQLEHGIPFAGGVSGTINGISGILTHLIKDYKLPIDPKEAILGIIMFLVYDGGHSIHEALWTLYQRELQNQYYLTLGLQLTPPGEKTPLRGLFVANYEHFIKMFQGSETGRVISEARNDAWQKILQYFNTNSLYKNTFVPAFPKILTKPTPPIQPIAQNTIKPISPSPFKPVIQNPAKPAPASKPIQNPAGGNIFTKKT